MAPHLGIPSSDVCEAPGVPQSQQQIPKSRKVKQKKNSKNSSAIKMCNTKIENSNSESKSGASQSLKKDIQCYESERVPPLPILTEDILIAKAVESLNISSQNPSRQLHKRRNKKKQYAPPENILNSKSILVENKDYLINPDNPILCASGNSELPSGQITNTCTPQQCGACGLEFSSVESLSQHLLRHIYEGMYAAQWLTQAMTLVSQQQEQTTQTITQETQYQDQTSTIPQPHDTGSVIQEQQYASILQQQNMVSIPQQQEQYASIILQQTSTQQPLQIQEMVFQQQTSSHKPFQLQETAPTIYSQATLCTPTLHSNGSSAQDAAFAHETNSLKECKNIDKNKTDVESHSTAPISPLIQDQNSPKLSSTRKLSNNAVKTQC